MHVRAISKIPDLVLWSAEQASTPAAVVAAREQPRLPDDPAHPRICWHTIPYLWELTVVRQAIETAWISVSSGGHSLSYWCQQRRFALQWTMYRAQDALIGAGPAWKRFFRGIHERADIARRAATFEKASLKLPRCLSSRPKSQHAAGSERRWPVTQGDRARDR